jgi:hypothetical protein
VVAQLVLASHPIGASVSTESSRTMSKRDCFTGSDDFSGKAQQGGLIRSKNFLPLERASERMCLTAEQHSQIASAYEKAAADEALPSQLRTAFVKKAKWFRMLCQIEAVKLSAGLVSTVVETAPERRYLSLAEKLSRARAGRGIT